MTTHPGGHEGRKGRKMTVKQFRQKADIARKYGQAKLDNGCKLLYHGLGGSCPWALRDKYGNTVDVADDPKELEYLFD